MRASYQAAERSYRPPDWVVFCENKERLRDMGVLGVCTREDWAWWRRSEAQKDRDANMKEQLRLSGKLGGKPRRTEQAYFFGYRLRGTAANWTSEELAAFGITDPSFGEDNGL